MGTEEAPIRDRDGTHPDGEESTGGVHRRDETTLRPTDSIYPRGDGKTSGPEAAVQVLKAEQELRDKNLNQIRSEAPKPVPESTGTAAADAETAAETTASTPAKKDAQEMAKEARELVAKAQAQGKTLTYAAAVKQVMTAK